LLLRLRIGPILHAALSLLNTYGRSRLRHFKSIGADVDAFIRDGERVFRTYFINGRGDEAMGTTWSYLDITPLGRQETWEDSPEGYPKTSPYKWWNWHDNYEAQASPDQRWVKVSDAGEAAFRKRDAEAKT
jgi:predicted dithiol-disulfide oxidoreductase (DUF899 family)